MPSLWTENGGFMIYVGMGVHVLLVSGFDVYITSLAVPVLEEACTMRWGTSGGRAQLSCRERAVWASNQSSIKSSRGNERSLILVSMTFKQSRYLRTAVRRRHIGGQVSSHTLVWSCLSGKLLW